MLSESTAVFFLLILHDFSSNSLLFVLDMVRKWLKNLSKIQYAFEREARDLGEELKQQVSTIVCSTKT